MQVVAEEEGLFFQAFFGHKSPGIQAHTVVRVQVRHTQAKPFVEHRARANVLGYAGYQRLERHTFAVADVACQGFWLPCGVTVIRQAVPGGDDLRAERGGGVVGFCARQAMAQAAHVFAVHARDVAGTAVGQRLAVKLEVALGHLDEHLLEQFGEEGVGHTARQHQFDQWPQHVAQRLHQCRRRCNNGIVVWERGVRHGGWAGAVYLN